MSSEVRLERLGLGHLADDPAALERELEQRVADGRRFEEEVVAREMEEIRKRLALQERALPEPIKEDGAVGRKVLDRKKPRSKTGLRRKE
jgi:hypothetical protein